LYDRSVKNCVSVPVWNDALDSRDSNDSDLYVYLLFLTATFALPFWVFKIGKVEFITTPIFILVSVEIKRAPLVCMERSNEYFS